jgi:hypothetical protein
MNIFGFQLNSPQLKSIQSETNKTPFSELNEMDYGLTSNTLARVLFAPRFWEFEPAWTPTEVDSVGVHLKNINCVEF